MYNLSLNDKEITFNNLEKKIYKYVCGEACRLMKEVLTHLDRRLMDERNTSSNIKELTNQEISHTAVWNVVQKLGSKIEEKEERKILLNKKGQLNGSKEVNVLFQEMDGIWLSIQGKHKSKKGKSKKKELKLGITYEGWKKRSGSNDSYVVENKIACASFKNSKKFKELSDATIAETYNTDEIEIRILNGDGAPWIKQGIDEEGVHFQLDPFHKNQAVYRKVKDKEEAKKLIKLLNSKKAEDAIQYITNLMIKYNSHEKEFKKLGELFDYFVANREGIVPYHLRKEINMPQAPEGLQYRHLGTMEHNICDVLAQRMKGRKMSWSIGGANNLAKILAKKASKRIYNIINEVCSGLISEDKLDKITEIITLTAADANKKVKKNKYYPVQQSSIPFTGYAMTNGRKAIQSFFQQRNFSELIYR